jgi:hypothetical protein
MNSGRLRTVRLRTLSIVGLLTVVGVLLCLEIAPPWPRVLEACLYIFCGVLMLTHKPFQQLREVLTVRQRSFVICLVGVIFVTQVVDRPGRTFPFVAWSMYTNSRTEPHHFFEFIGICENGREVTIPSNHLFPSQISAVPWAVFFRWKRKQIEQDELTRTELEQDIRLLLTAIATRFNGIQPKNAVNRIRIVECTVPLPAPGSKVEISRQVVGEFPVH